MLSLEMFGMLLMEVPACLPWTVSACPGQSVLAHRELPIGGQKALLDNNILVDCIETSSFWHLGDFWKAHLAKVLCVGKTVVCMWWQKKPLLAIPEWLFGKTAFTCRDELYTLRVLFKLSGPLFGSRSLGSNSLHIFQDFLLMISRRRDTIIKRQAVHVSVLLTKMHCAVWRK